MAAVVNCALDDWLYKAAAVLLSRLAESSSVANTSPHRKEPQARSAMATAVLQQLVVFRHGPESAEHSVV